MIAVDKPFTVNEQLAHRSIRHALYVERLKNSESRRILAFLGRDVFPDLTEKIGGRWMNIVGTGRGINFADRRILELRRSIRSILDGGMLRAYEMVERRLQDIAATEAEYQVSALKQTLAAPLKVAMTEGALSVPFDFVAPSPAMLKTIVTARPFQGAILGDWFKSLSMVTADRIDRDIKMCLVEGESVDQLVRRVRGSSELAFGDGSLRQVRARVEALVRTAVGHVSNETREASYAENSDVVKGVQIVATLDTSTCEQCAGLDGEILEPGSGRRPPFHFGCRCTTAPVLKSWKELGIPLKDIDAGTRASMDGQVPASMTYGEWLKTQTQDVQDDALGPARAELFRNGKAGLDEFTDDRGRLLTLAQLREKEKLSAKA